MHYMKPYDETTPGSNTTVLIKTEDKKTIENTDLNISRISIFITDLGLQKVPLDLAKLTDSQISFGISTYAANLSSIASESLDQGRSTAILLPTQVFNSAKYDPGPSALLISDSVSESARKFKNILSRLNSNRLGVYFASDSIFTMRKESILNILNILEDNSDKFKFIAYYDTLHGEFMTNIISSSNIAGKAIVINNIIDTSLIENDIITSLENLAELSLKNKSVAVGSISPTKISLAIVQKWLAINKDRVILIPLDDLVHEKKG